MLSTTDPGGLPRGTTIGRYFLLKKLGEGGMGLVYAAFDPELDRKIALKLLRPSPFGTDPVRQARLVREAQAMARVSHPNVMSVYDVGSHAEQVFLAMELVDGGTLTDWIQQRSRKVDEIVPVFCEAGRGLAAAHAAGLVHRDFKPENVLVGRDGRVRVTDFGLARLDDHRSPTIPVPVLSGLAPSQEAGTRSAANPNLTQAGAVMGTPLFMSPEQADGTIPDARSDQYSFCASLFWGIYGTAPPGPFTRGRQAPPAGDAITEEVAPGAAALPRPAAGEAITLPREPRVPANVRRVLTRGLSEGPDQRYPSMDDLLRELAHGSTASQRRWLAVAVAAVSISAVAGGYQVMTARQQSLCSGAKRRLDGIWDEAARAAVLAAFDRTAPSRAARLTGKAVETLDRYAQSWAQMHTDACQATRVRGEQTEAILELRMICLDRRLRQLDVLARLLRAPDEAMVRRSLDAALELPSLASCADVTALTASSPLPAEPAVRQRIEALNRKLDEVPALLAAAHFRSALLLATAVVQEAEAVPYWPLRAEAAYWQGRVLERTGDPNGADRALRAAVLAAESGRAEEVKIKSLSRLVRVNGYALGRFDQAQFFADLAESALRSFTNERLEFDFLLQKSGFLSNQGKLNESLAPFERALELADRAVGPEHPDKGVLLSNIASVYQALGRSREALGLLRRAIEILSASRGPDHPSVAYAHYNLATLLSALGDLRGALGSIQEAIRIREAALGEEHPEVADALDILATILQADGLYAEALSESQRALAIKRKALGEEHLDLCYSLENMGLAYLGLDQPAKAIVVLERALVLRERGKQEPGELAEGRFALARALWDARRDRPRARTLAADAREGYQAKNDVTKAGQVAAWLSSR